MCVWLFVNYVLMELLGVSVCNYIWCCCYFCC